MAKMLERSICATPFPTNTLFPWKLVAPRVHRPSTSEKTDTTSPGFMSTNTHKSQDWIDLSPVKVQTCSYPLQWGECHVSYTLGKRWSLGRRRERLSEQHCHTEHRQQPLSWAAPHIWQQEREVILCLTRHVPVHVYWAVQLLYYRGLFLNYLGLTEQANFAAMYDVNLFLCAQLELLNLLSPSVRCSDILSASLWKEPPSSWLNTTIKLESDPVDCPALQTFFAYLGPLTGSSSTSGICGWVRITTSFSSSSFFSVNNLHICCFGQWYTQGSELGRLWQSIQIKMCTFFSSSPNFCLISSSEARWVLARTQVYEGGWDRHMSSFWKRCFARSWPTAAKTLLVTLKMQKKMMDFDPWKFSFNI